MDNAEKLLQLYSMGKYKCDEHGNIWSFSNKHGGLRNEGRILKPGKQRYLMYVFVCKRGKRFNMSGHRAIILFFKGKINPGMHINHINCIKHDNRLENLEVVSPQRNREHAKENGLYGRKTCGKGENNNNAKLTEIKAIEIKTSVGVKLKELGDRYGVSLHTIKAIRGGRIWKHL